MKVEAGDLLLIRTGNWERRNAIGPRNPTEHGASGLHAACLPWLKSRDISMLGGGPGAGRDSQRLPGIFPAGTPGDSDFDGLLDSGQLQLYGGGEDLQRGEPVRVHGGGEPAADGERDGGAGESDSDFLGDFR